MLFRYYINNMTRESKPHDYCRCKKNTPIPTKCNDTESIVESECKESVSSCSSSSSRSSSSSKSSKTNTTCLTKSTPPIQDAIHLCNTITMRDPCIDSKKRTKRCKCEGSRPDKYVIIKM